MYRAKEVSSVVVENQSVAQTKQFLYQREAAIKVGLLQAFAVMAFVFFGVIVLGLKFGNHPVEGVDWGKLFSDAAFFGWLVGFLYLCFWLWRWNKLAWLETALGVNLDRDPRVGNDSQPDAQERNVMYFKLERPDGSVSMGEFPFDPKVKRWIVAIAQATVNNRPNSQSAMRTAHRMPRPKHEKVMDGFVKLRVLEKEYPDLSNSRYVVSEPKVENMQILRGISDGDFEMLKSRWGVS